MGCFLLNELGEVLLEINSGLGFGAIGGSAQCCGKFCHRFCS